MGNCGLDVQGLDTFRYERYQRVNLQKRNRLDGNVGVGDVVLLLMSQRRDAWGYFGDGGGGVLFLAALTGAEIALGLDGVVLIPLVEEAPDEEVLVLSELVSGYTSVFDEVVLDFLLLVSLLGYSCFRFEKLVIELLSSVSFHLVHLER